MGQTQLLLVVLGFLLVGIAIVLGSSMFGAGNDEGNRNAIIHDLQNFAAHAASYYWKPEAQDGGNRSYSGVTIRKIYPMVENANARYYLESATIEQCVIVGVGKIVSGDDSVRVRMRVTPQRNFVEILN